MSPHCALSGRWSGACVCLAAGGKEAELAGLSWVEGVQVLGVGSISSQ